MYLSVSHSPMPHPLSNHHFFPLLVLAVQASALSVSVTDLQTLFRSPPPPVQGLVQTGLFKENPSKKYDNVNYQQPIPIDHKSGRLQATSLILITRPRIPPRIEGNSGRISLSQAIRNVNIVLVIHNSTESLKAMPRVLRLLGDNRRAPPRQPKRLDTRRDPPIFS